MEAKMGETAASVGNLEVSVSFGRFENDLLSWERWSSFSQNKYLEEVEKCSTPGSVAEKKAYFEAHYKRIAAKKAEIEDQQKQFETTLSMAAKNDVRSTITKNKETDEPKQKEADSLVEDMPIGASPAAKKSEIMDNYKQLELDLMPGNNDQAYPIKSTQSGTADSYFQTYEILLVNEVYNLNNEPGSEIVVRKPNEGDTDEVFQTTIVVGEKKESNFKSEPGDCLVKVEHEGVKGSPWAVEATAEANFDTGEVFKSSTGERTKLKAQKISKVQTERSVTKIKKAPVSVTPKSPLIPSSTPKGTKPSSTPSRMSTSRSPAVDGIISSKSSIMSSYAEHKKPAPKTDMISPSPGLVICAPIPATTKPSLMEKMKDKDIVKQASKTFQPKPDPMMYSGEQSASLPKQVLRTAKETRVKEMLTSQKGKEWLHKNGDNSSNVAQAARPLVNSKATTKTYRGKEMKCLSRNPNVNEATGSHILTKSKEVNKTAAKYLQQSRQFKATPLPAFYRGTGVSKSLAPKGSTNSQSTEKHPDKCP